MFSQNIFHLFFSLNDNFLGLNPTCIFFIYVTRSVKFKYTLKTISGAFFIINRLKTFKSITKKTEMNNIFPSFLVCFLINVIIGRVTPLTTENSKQIFLVYNYMQQYLSCEFFTPKKVHKKSWKNRNKWPWKEQRGNHLETIRFLFHPSGPCFVNKKLCYR